MNAVVDHIEDLGGGIDTYYFLPEQRISFIPGQYIELYLPHDNVDDRGTRRWFTVSSLPSDTLIALTTGFPDKPSSFKQRMSKLHQGDKVVLSAPLGDFVLPKDRSSPLVFVAAGTGCTPYASMIKWLIERDEERDIQLLYAATSPDAFLFSDVWQNYAPLKVTRMVSRTNSSWNERIGHLDIPFVLMHARETKDSLIYLAGPQSLIEPLYDELLSHVPRYRLLLDYFPGY